MFILKNNYFLYIDNTQSINLKILKKPEKFNIIYRNNYLKKNLKKIISLRKACKTKKIKFYVANNYILAKKIKADGIYISAYNKKIYNKIDTIGSAHSYKEINQKIKQSCKTILLSRLFKTNYKNKKNFFGLVKFNLIIKNFNTKIVPLGGINSDNLLKMNLVNSDGFAIMSGIKKKPAIASRLF